MTHLLDHVFTAIITVLFPLYSWSEVRKAERQLGQPDGAPYDTVGDYKRTMTWLIALAAMCLANWIYQGRGMDVLGLGSGASLLGWAGGGGLALVGLGLTLQQARQLSRDPEEGKKLREQLVRFSFLLPHTPRELRWFNAVSLTAGVCEEIIYRGFLIWYLQSWLGAIPAVMVSSLAFGLAHSYQGMANVPRTAFIGLWFGGIYFLTGSLWLAMVSHFVFDVIGGRMIYLSLKTEEEGS